MSGVLTRCPRIVLLSLLAAVMVGGVSILSPAAPAHAQADWCNVDPILLINGKTVNVIAGVMGSPAAVRANVRHAHFRIFLPVGVDAQVVGYSGDYFTESAEIIRDSRLTYTPGRPVLMRVELTFEAKARMPVALFVEADGSRQQIGGGVTSSRPIKGVYLLRW
jgi:hypothetical protein